MKPRFGGVFVLMRVFVDSFRRNADGSWTCIAAVTLMGQSGPVRFTPGATFQPGMMFMGIRVAMFLDELAKYPHPGDVRQG